MQLSAYPLVAVVTPVFDGEEFLSETMESVQALEYPNLVHVVMDNASNDSTPEILDSYRNRRVPLLTRRQGRTVSMAANWNAAVAMTPPEARYFRILCADDTLRPDAVDRQVEIAERDPEVGIVGCLWRYQRLCGEELPVNRDVFDGREIVYSFLRREHAALCGMNMLVRQTELAVGRSFYDESLASFDNEANVRICLRSKFGFVHSELGRWRNHPNNTTSRVAKVFAHERCWLAILDRYGPDVLGFREYIECRTTYRHHLLRQFLKAYRHEGGGEVLAHCLEYMRFSGDPVTLLDFAAALTEWTKLAFMRQRHSVGRPRPKSGSRYMIGAPVRAPEF